MNIAGEGTGLAGQTVQRGDKMNNILAVGLGGAAGAIFRYLISLLPVKTSFPFVTLFTNLSGALLIGIVVGISALKSTSGSWLLFWKTGVCGGFTTFSAFSLETLSLFQNQKHLQGSLYIVLSVALCIAGVALGQFLVVRLSKI